MRADFFKGLKVVELASVLAGPSVGLFFAELGAEVLKIENKTTGGDVTRTWKLTSEDADGVFSAYYASVNFGKTSLLLNLSEQSDNTTVRAIIANADIVLSNFRVSAAQRWGLDYGSLSGSNPALIYAQIYGFSKDDTRPAFDVVLQAEAGFMYMNGEAAGNPVKMPVALIDLLAAHQLKEGILVGLLQRQRTGKGCLVETSLFESAIASLANQSTNWLMAGFIPQRMGTLHPNIAPYGELFTCLDGKEVVLAVGTDRQFQSLARLLGYPEWSEHPFFTTNAERVQHRPLLMQALTEEISRWKSQELSDACIQADIPIGVVRNMKEVFDNPVASQMVESWNLPDGTPARSVRTVAFHLSEIDNK